MENFAGIGQRRFEDVSVSDPRDLVVFGHGRFAAGFRVHDQSDAQRRGRRRRRRCVVNFAVVVVLLVFPIFDFVEIVDGAGIPSAGHAILADGGQHHSLADAFLESAVLASIPLRFRDFAVALRNAGVHPLVLNGPFEEAFTPATVNLSIKIKLLTDTFRPIWQRCLKRTVVCHVNSVTCESLV